MSERDDRDTALAGIGGLQTLVGVLEIVVGFERVAMAHLSR